MRRLTSVTLNSKDNFRNLGQLEFLSLKSQNHHYQDVSIQIVST